jgi:hypothetical protein
MKFIKEIDIQSQRLNEQAFSIICLRLKAIEIFLENFNKKTNKRRKYFLFINIGQRFKKTLEFSFLIWHKVAKFRILFIFLFDATLILV